MKTTTATQKEVIKKAKNRAFGKDIYLIGEDESGEKYWLEAPSWDCGWYWGFGYVETYTNNQNPEKAQDISSHQHINGFFGQQEKYNSEKQVWQKGDYINNLFDTPRLNKLTFNENEGWKLSELFKSFYHLAESAAFFGRGGMHVTSNPCESVLKNIEWSKHINKVLIPAVTKEIILILSPK